MIYGFLVFNATFNNISVISWLSVYWWRKPENPEKTKDCQLSIYWWRKPEDPEKTTDCQLSIYWWRKPEDPEKTTDCRKSLTNFIT
jgi:hypothetical protein